MTLPEKEFPLNQESDSLKSLKDKAKEPNISESDLASGLFQGVFNQTFTILLALATAIGRSLALRDRYVWFTF